jgi:hypothetical protein
MITPFDGYPYLVTRIGHSALRHLAVLPREWPSDRLVGFARRQADANRLDTCVVLGRRSAVYFTADGVEGRDAYVPTGLPVVERIRLGSPLPRTPDLTTRRASLRTWADAQTGPGYIVGDGLEGGRRATYEDLTRLVGLDGKDPYPGLARCVDCGDLAGDFLATDGEGNGDLSPRVIRVHCLCENHNRCARCGSPLAERRLSAYHFVEDTGRPCYVAAYCAFSHRCTRTSR